MATGILKAELQALLASMKKVRPTPWQLFYLTLGIVLVVQLTRAIILGPGNKPRSADVAASGRQSVPKSGVDTRLVLPDQPVIAGDGVVEPADRETKLGANVAGQIGKIFVKEGDQVKVGEALLQLENSVETAELAVAQADYETARTDYAKTLHGLRPEDVEAAIADTGAAQAKLDDAKANLARVLKLEQHGAATKEELEKARNQAAADLNAYKSSAAKRRAAVTGSRVEDIEEAKERVDAAGAKVEQAKARLERLTIRSPLDGKILYLLYRPGEYYNPNNPASTDPLFVVGDLTVLRARIDVDERDIAHLHLNASAYVVADGFPGRRFPGRVVEIGSRMGRKNVRTDDPTTRIDTKILEVVLLLEGTKDLIPGLRVTGYIDTGTS
jgi:multidrug resistance efflux pump